MTQHLPRIVGQDKGIWRRIRILPFVYQIPDDTKDLHFVENVLAPELVGILRWMVDGALLHQDRNETDILPGVCKELLTTYRSNNDQFSEFVEECLIVKDGAFTPNEDFFQAALEWGTRNRAPALMSSSKHNFLTMFANCPLTPKVKDDRRTVEGSKRRGFAGFQLSGRGLAKKYAHGG